MNPKHYVIGDVHGEFDMLMKLVAQLPKDAKLIFVGDLVNRGSKSKEVVEFVKEKAFGAVQGNHETYILDNANFFLESIEAYRKDKRKAFWTRLMGTEFLYSYGLLTPEIDDEIYLIDNPPIIEKLKEDLVWIESLPCSLELGKFSGYKLPVVVTHGSAGDYWHLKDSNPQEFKEVCQCNREKPSTTASVFNIYGHVIVSNVTLGETYASIDTGCGKKFDGARLSAFCIETQEIFEARRD